MADADIIKGILWVGGTILALGLGMVLSYLFKGLPGRVAALERQYGELNGRIMAIDVHVQETNRRMENIEAKQSQILDILMRLPKRSTDL